MTKQEAVDVIHRCVFEDTDPCSIDYGRRLIHCFAGPYGADWDEENAIEYIERSARIEWVRHMLGHNLAAEGPDGIRYFDCKQMP